MMESCPEADSARHFCVFSGVTSSGDKCVVRNLRPFGSPQGEEHHHRLPLRRGAAFSLARFTEDSRWAAPALRDLHSKPERERRWAGQPGLSSRPATIRRSHLTALSAGIAFYKITATPPYSIAMLPGVSWASPLRPLP